MQLHKNKSIKQLDDIMVHFPERPSGLTSEQKLPTMVLIYLINTLLFVDHNLHRTSCCTLKRVQTGLAQQYCCRREIKDSQYGPVESWYTDSSIDTSLFYNYKIEIYLHNSFCKTSSVWDYMQDDLPDPELMPSHNLIPSEAVL